MYIQNNKGSKMILVVHQREYQPKTNTDHLKQLFGFCHSENPLKF